MRELLGNVFGHITFFITFISDEYLEDAVRTIACKKGDEKKCRYVSVEELPNVMLE